FLKQSGLFGIQVPKCYNGLGCSSSEFAKIIEVFGSDISLGVMLGAHQSIGYKGLLLYGDKYQHDKYLPRLASGEMIAAFALTEPNAGSDVNSINATATLSDDGSHYILNGTKIWITNGNLASFFTVFAKTKLDRKTEKISAFIVERDFGGITNGPNEKKMGIKSVNSVTVNFDNVKVPAENLLGVPGDGFKIAMNILNSGRFGTGALMCSVQRYLLKKA
ncbi:very long-chain specific acyl-CoA dehydrogenase, mitochondrial-like, partial [Pempheris klunzingeri]|uniref:very long-chain specific acyl-CoA dehydrogenase, mitochondrial-like n=1 Tax=Pempheris klunzingeri TaxID=3127111 RepID=UPI0039800B70